LPICLVAAIVGVQFCQMGCGHDVEAVLRSGHHPLRGLDLDLYLTFGWQCTGMESVHGDAGSRQAIADAR
jgi:hypothetical protein